MSAVRSPRVVVVTRRSEYEELLGAHGTRGQAEFFLSGRGQAIEVVEARHRRLERALAEVLALVPPAWRRARADRSDLDRFLFAPDDIVVAVGQDGLVANVAKYLAGQPVVGVNPDPGEYGGVLVPHPAAATGDLLADIAAGRASYDERTMAAASLDDGQRLLALNEVFVGHRTHQSARYTLDRGGVAERQSSSGLIVTTGTGATGWALSVARERQATGLLPAPGAARLAFFVREAWPSVATGTSVTAGVLDGAEALVVRSEMNGGGVVFGDGIEADNLAFGWGRSVTLGVAEERLRLVP